MSFVGGLARYLILLSGLRPVKRPELTKLLNPNLKNVKGINNQKVKKRKTKSTALVSDSL